MNLKTVKPIWIKDSFIAGEFLPTQKYELANFEGLKIGVVGYKKNDFNEIVESAKVERNSGERKGDGQVRCRGDLHSKQPDKSYRNESRISVHLPVPARVHQGSSGRPRMDQHVYPAKQVSPTRKILYQTRVSRFT
jgi:hypothetical protein